jgi:hypothetical protein
VPLVGCGSQSAAVLLQYPKFEQQKPVGHGGGHWRLLIGVETVFGEEVVLGAETVFAEVVVLGVEAVFAEVVILGVEAVVGEEVVLGVETVFGEEVVLGVETVFGEVVVPPAQWSGVLPQNPHCEQHESDPHGGWQLPPEVLFVWPPPAQWSGELPQNPHLEQQFPLVHPVCWQFCAFALFIKIKATRIQRIVTLIMFIVV